VSHVPYQALRPVNDPTLKSYPILADLDNVSTYQLDSVTRYGAYWTSALIRNYGAFPIGYRLQPGENRVIIPAGTERNIKGWGSYISVSPQNPSDNPTMIGVIEFEMVSIGDSIVSSG